MRFTQLELRQCHAYVTLFGYRKFELKRPNLLYTFFYNIMTAELVINVFVICFFIKENIFIHTPIIICMYYNVMFIKCNVHLFHAVM